jgi:hypothetical protein
MRGFIFCFCIDRGVSALLEMDGHMEIGIYPAYRIDQGLGIPVIEKDIAHPDSTVKHPVNHLQGQYSLP